VVEDLAVVVGAYTRSEHSTVSTVFLRPLMSMKKRRTHLVYDATIGKQRLTSEKAPPKRLRPLRGANTGKEAQRRKAPGNVVVTLSN
jgi:hypothetical protein